MKHLQPGSKLYQAIEGPFSKLVKRSRWPLTCETSRSRMSGSNLTLCHWKVSNQELQKETIKHTFCRSRNLIQLQTPQHKTSLATHGVIRVSWDLGILWQGGAVCMCSCQYCTGISGYSAKRRVQHACVHAANTVLGWSKYFRTYDLVWTTHIPLNFYAIWWCHWASLGLHWP